MLEMSPNDDFEQLRPINELLSKCLHRAILDASEHFRVNNYGYQPHVFARYKHLLFKQALTLEAEIYGFKIHDIGGDSFCLVYQDYTYRFYKSSDGNVPPPGDSNTCNSFYNANGRRLPIQRSFSELGWEIYNDIPSNNISLIAYFDYNSIDGRHKLNWLKVACPQFATRSHVDCFWIVEVNLPLYNEIVDGFKRSMTERDDLTYSLREDTVSSTDSDEDNAFTELTDTERNDLTYHLRDKEATLAEDDEDTSNEEDNGTSRQIE